MRIVEYDGQARFPREPSAVTVGSFDGVHRGHRKIISRMVSIARQRGLRSVVVTFEPHPRRVLKGGVSGPLGLLTTLDEKVELLQAELVDMLCVVRFTPEFAVRSSDNFIRSLLVGEIGAECVVVGYDHGFGRNRSGGGDELRRLGNELGFDVVEVDEVRIEHEHFSSTRIRSLLAEGRMEEANSFLGAPYMISGTVVEGEGNGRTIGFPTANILPPDPHKLLPKAGVYAATTVIDGNAYRAIMNVGVRPTVSSLGVTTVEAHILGWSGSLYGRELRFSLLRFLRDEKKFDSLDALREQIEKDKKGVEL